MSSTHEVFWKSLRLDPAVIERALDKLDKQRETGIDRNRHSRRFKFRSQGCLVDVQQPDSVSSSRFLVMTRDVSAGGVSFLHRGYVHLHSRCTFHVKDRSGNTQILAGNVVRADYLTDGAHLISCSFDKPVDVAQFCEGADHRQVILAMTDKEQVNQISAAFSTRGVAATIADVDPDTIYKSLDAQSDGLLLASSEYTEDIVRTVRKKGYARSIFVAAEKPDEVREDMTGYGVTRVVPIPPTERDVDMMVDMMRGQTEPQAA